MKVRYFLALFAGLALLAALLLPSGGVARAQVGTVMVASEELNVRSAPTTDASIVAVLSNGDVVAVFDTVRGEEVLDGNDTWYRTRSGNFIYSGLTVPARAQGSDSRDDLSGRWIDANLSTATVRAMEGNRVVYSALSTIGAVNHPTPVGAFTILERVLNETMDSSTIGIPKNARGGYYLTDVLYTQYFIDDGTALHYNYWSPASAFGSRAGSNGCLGLKLGDAAYFWYFATVGTPVIVHY